MKRILWVFIFLIIELSYAQIEYSFDYVVVQTVFSGDECTSDTSSEVYEFINSKYDNISLKVISKTKDSVFCSFWDFENKVRASASFDRYAFFNASSYNLQNWVQFDRYNSHYTLNIRQFNIDSVTANNAKKTYILSRKRNNRDVKLGIASRRFIVDSALSAQYKAAGFNRYRRFFWKDKRINDFIIERAINSINGEVIVKRKIDTILPVQRTLFLKEKPYYPLKLKY